METLIDSKKLFLENFEDNLLIFLDNLRKNREFFWRLISCYRKENQELNPEDFILFPWFLSQRYKDYSEYGGAGFFYFDGDFSIVFIKKSSLISEGDTGRENIDGAVISCTLLENVYRKPWFNFRLLKESGYQMLNDPCFIIVQIQGPTKRLDKGLSPILQNLRWEKFLIELLNAFTQQMRLRSLYLLPIEFNVYYELVDEETKRRLYLRYNKTAERMGFKKDEISGFYRLDVNFRY